MVLMSLCPSHSCTKKEWSEDTVIQGIKEFLDEPGTVDAVIDLVMDLQGRDNVSLPAFEKQLSETNTAIDNLLNAIQQGILTKSTKERLEQLEASRDELEQKIVLEKMAKPKVSEDFIRFWLKRFQYLDTAKLEHRKMLIGTFVNAIYLYDDKAIIALNYKDGTKTVNFNDMECALSQRASIPGSDLEILSPPFLRRFIEEKS